nr:alpha/beta hydrolase [Limosilactobacillus galli]
MTTSKNLKPEQVASMNEIIEHNQALLQELNTGVHSPAAIRAAVAQLTQQTLDPSVEIRLPFYSDFGRNIHIGKRVFINSGVTFTDLGGIYLTDDVLVGQKTAESPVNAKTGEPQRQDATYKPLLKLRSTFPTNTRVLNIYGDKEDGSHSDGDVPVNSAKSLKYLVSGCAKSYREVEIKGANAQHSTLHNNSQVNRELINFLWRK